MTETTNRTILLLIDGLRPDVAEAELAAGNLPNLDRLTAVGTRTRAATAFPSTTSVAYLPFLTGELPGRCNVPSIRWLDRERYTGRWWKDRIHIRSYCGYQAGMLDGDISPDVQTIFDLVPESVAIFSMITRGLGPGADRIQDRRKFWGTVSHYTENHQPGDDAVSEELLRTIDQEWRFIFAQFPAVDGHTHASHPSAPRVLDSLRKVDATVGRMMAKLAARGITDSTQILLVSDHGAAAVNDHLDLADWFRAQGVRTMSHPVVWTSNPVAAVMVAGNAAAAVYVNPGVPRSHRLDIGTLRSPATFGTDADLISRLIAEPAVALLAAENGRGGVRVITRDGEADLDRENGIIHYRRISGDPLAVGGDLSTGTEEWLAATIDGPFPDSAVSLLDQFSSPRAGDLVVAAAVGWDFRKAWEYPEHRSGHGSLIAEHMLTPLWSNHPLPPRRGWRTVDTFRIMTDWLGVSR